MAMSGVVNGISNAEAAWLNAGGLGILLGDGPGNLPHPSLEKIIEACYSYALSSSLKISFDYQLIANLGYTTDKGPVNLFAGRVRWAF